MVKNFNNKKVIKDEIVDTVLRLKALCRQYGIPCFVAMPEVEDGKKTQYYTEILSPAVLEMELSDDRISQMINVINGFDTVPPRSAIEIDFD